MPSTLVSQQRVKHSDSAVFIHSHSSRFTSPHAESTERDIVSTVKSNGRWRVWARKVHAAAERQMMGRTAEGSWVLTERYDLLCLALMKQDRGQLSSCGPVSLTLNWLQPRMARSELSVFKRPDKGEGMDEKERLLFSFSASLPECDGKHWCTGGFCSAEAALWEGLRMLWKHGLLQGNDTRWPWHLNQTTLWIIRHLYIVCRNGGVSFLFLSLVSSHGKQSQKVCLRVIFRMGIAKGVDVRILPAGLSFALVF